MRIVIDTNIWVSGLLWKGEPWRLLKLAEASTIEICLAYQMLLELEEVLNYERFDAQAGNYRANTSTTGCLCLDALVSCRGDACLATDCDCKSDDDVFLLCAAAANVDYVVTADRHLLSLGAYKEIPIITIDAFFMRLHPRIGIAEKPIRMERDTGAEGQ